MIKFVHKIHAEKAKGSAKIIITYSFIEIALGFVLLFTNIFATFLIFKYVIYPQTLESSIKTTQNSRSLETTKPVRK